MGEAATGRMAENCRDLSDVAKGGDGAKSEAAIEFSPGLQPSVRRPGTAPCRWRPRSYVWDV